MRSAGSAAGTDSRYCGTDSIGSAARLTEALWLSADGEVERIATGEAARRVASRAPLLVHMPATARRLGRGPFAAYDLLELFAFVHPARFCLPTARGLIEAVGLP